MRTTLFALAYGIVTIIPIEISMPTAKTVFQVQRDESQELERHLDWVDETRGNVAIRMASYQQRAIVHYNTKTQSRAFRTETLVLKMIFENTIERGAEKLQPNQEGPYVVFKTGDSGAYHLETLDGVFLLHPWNVSNLKQ